MIEAVLRRLVTAAVEAFPIDKERKAVILRRILDVISRGGDIK